MDANRQQLQKKLEDLLSPAMAVAVQMLGMDQGGQTPHLDDIELPAHALGQHLSRMMQEGRAREVAAEAACPTCFHSCRVTRHQR
jgi:hypothetical protein